MAQQFEYQPYGAVRFLAGGWIESSNLFAWRYLFQAGRFDSTSGLYHFGTRELSPTLGRWMQNDAGGYIDGANTYQFVLSNPLVYTDPSGLCADSGWKWWLQKATAVLQVVAGAAEIWLGSSAPDPRLRIDRSRLGHSDDGPGEPVRQRLGQDGDIPEDRRRGQVDGRWRYGGKVDWRHRRCEHRDRRVGQGAVEHSQGRPSR